MNVFEWMLFGCVVVLALAGAYATGQNRVLVGVVQMWRQRCADLSAEVAAEKLRRELLETELGASQDAAAQDVELWR